MTMNIGLIMLGSHCSHLYSINLSEVREVDIRVKLLGPIHWTVTRETFYSKHGPVIKSAHGSFIYVY